MHAGHITSMQFESISTDLGIPYDSIWLELALVSDIVAEVSGERRDG